MGSFTPCCVLFVVFLIFSSNLCLYSFALPFCFAVFDCLELEGPNYERIQAALAFAQEIEDFDDLIDPCHLFTYCLGSEPIQYVLEKILREEKKMAIQYSKEKYAHSRGMKHEPLSQLTLDPKRQKLHDEKGKATVSSPIQIIPSSPTPTIEMTASTPPITHSKGKGKVGKSVWDDPATALGRAHNVITDDELKGLSSVPSHELVSHHIHKLVQVLGESLRLATDYLRIEEKVVVVNSKLESIEVESSELRKDLIEAMDKVNKAKEKIKEMNEALKVEKMLVVQKDEEVQAAL